MVDHPTPTVDSTVDLSDHRQYRTSHGMPNAMLLTPFGKRVDAWSDAEHAIEWLVRLPSNKIRNSKRQKQQPYL